MTSRTASEAVAAFSAPLLDAARCITDRPLVSTGSAPGDKTPTLVFLPAGQVVPLDSRFGRRSVGLRIQHLYRVVPVGVRGRNRWTVESVAYIYEVFDRDERELFAYHWDPREASESWAKFPHLHVSRRLPALPIGDGEDSLVLGKLHFPTEPIAFAALVRLLIRELGVPPRRPDWERILDESAAVFRRSLAAGDAA